MMGITKLVRTDSWMISWNEIKGKCDMVRTPLGEERHRERVGEKKEVIKDIGIGPGEEVSVDFWS